MAPVLQDVLVRVARLQNEAPDVADRELAPYLGDVSIEAAMSFGRLIGVAGDASERIYRTNGAGIRLRKMFAVADELTLEEIAVPLGPDEDAVKRGEVLPAHVLRAYLLGLPWIAIGPTGGFIMTEERRPNVLNEAERIACNVIRHCGGVATRREIGKSIEMAGYTSGFVAKLVREAITLRELEPGLYVSVGNPPEADAVDSARSRLPSKRAAIVIGDASSLSKTRAAPDMLGFAIRVTAATMRNQGYEIPVRFQHRFPVPGQIKLVDGQTVEISSSKRFLRLHRLYPGMEPGDHFWVSVRSDAVAIELVKAERTTGQASGTTEAEVE